MLQLLYEWVGVNVEIWEMCMRYSFMTEETCKAKLNYCQCSVPRSFREVFRHQSALLPVLVIGDSAKVQTNILKKHHR